MPPSFRAAHATRSEALIQRMTAPGCRAGPAVAAPANTTPPAVNWTPLPSSASRIAVALFGTGVRAARSKSATVDWDTRAAAASSCCDQASRARAALT